MGGGSSSYKASTAEKDVAQAAAMAAGALALAAPETGPAAPFVTAFAAGMMAGAAIDYGIGMLLDAAGY